MGLDLGIVKLAIWDHFRTQTRGRQMLLTDACNAVETAFAMADDSHYPFKAAPDVNKPYLQQAAANAARKRCQNIELLSLADLMAGTGGGCLHVSGLNDLVRALEKPLLKGACLENHEPVLGPHIVGGGQQFVRNKTRFALTEYMNSGNAKSAKSTFLMEYMIEAVALFLLCGALGYRAGFDEMILFIRGISEGLLLGEYAHHRPAPRGTFVAIVL